MFVLLKTNLAPQTSGMGAQMYYRTGSAPERMQEWPHQAKMKSSKLPPEGQDKGRTGQILEVTCPDYSPSLQKLDIQRYLKLVDTHTQQEEEQHSTASIRQSRTDKDL